MKGTQHGIIQFVPFEDSTGLSFLGEPTGELVISMSRREVVIRLPP